MLTYDWPGAFLLYSLRDETAVSRAYSTVGIHIGYGSVGPKAECL